MATDMVRRSSNIPINDLQDIQNKLRYTMHKPLKIYIKDN